MENQNSPNTHPSGAAHPDGSSRTHLSVEEARQGETVFKGPRQRRLFLLGILGAIILAGIIAVFML